METRKIDVLFGFIVIGFLVVTIILIRDFNKERISDFKEYTATLTSIVKEKNNSIIILYNQLMAQQKENENLKNALADTRNALETLSKAPVTAPAPAAAAK